MLHLSIGHRLAVLGCPRPKADPSFLRFKSLSSADQADLTSCLNYCRFKKPFKRFRRFGSFSRGLADGTIWRTTIERSAPSSFIDLSSLEPLEAAKAINRRAVHVCPPANAIKRRAVHVCPPAKAHQPAMSSMSVPLPTPSTAVPSMSAPLPTPSTRHVVHVCPRCQRHQPAVPSMSVPAANAINPPCRPFRSPHLCFFFPGGMATGLAGWRQVLVDLSGMIRGAVQEVLALRPAAVQVAANRST